MSIIIQHKRGDSFKVSGVYENDAGAASPLTGTTITSQIRNRNNALVSELAVIVDDIPNGLYHLDAGDTSNWPIDLLWWDIQFTSSAGVGSSETVTIDVVKDVTR
jgi:hypothetical protein